MSHANALRQPSIAFPPDVLAHGPSQDFTVRPLNDALGAEIVGIDLARALSAADFARVRRAHLDHHLVVFRDQRITPRQHIDFSRRFGRLMIHVLHQFHLAHNPEILVVSNIVENGAPVGLGDAGKYWHSDISYKPLPSLGSLLHAQELPAIGGDTLFANMHRAYETLPRALREAVDGRRALFVSEGFTTRIEGVAADESRQILDELFAHSTRSEHIYRHQWRDHDLVFWDNRSLIHLAAGCPPELRRKLYRTTIEGDAPF
ncbi:putative taurine dioxygenase [Bordetella bronchiseptica MBORD681]|uniref:TauD/TfdA dioxygenase family protein n=1 Tax=Bordetella bronchiseptica TaxID=518 RepID=UPI000460B03F|nr:TauD/TfdA family dioxygenase [Bordetella bronchiseptica]KDD04821.1 putative taurine dioxygenase [Bordetella bronchiseptica MBORD681]KDD08443.1 putative taurine dioxygenase [Bordetella bronchiseptica MBORD698]